MKDKENKCKPCKTCEENSQDLFLESIEQEIRAENWQLLWQKYGKAIVIAFVVIAAVVVFYNSWQKSELEKRDAISVEFSRVQNMIEIGQIDQALQEMQNLSCVKNIDYANLAKLEYAALLRLKNDKESLVVYQSIFQNLKTNILIRDLAYVLYVNTALDFMTTQEINENINNFIKELIRMSIVSSWKLLAKESAAYCYIKLGQNDKAKEVLESFIKTTEVPSDMSERARVLLQFINK